MSGQDATALPAPGLDPLCDFTVAPTSLIDARALQQRVDRKYLLAASAITSLLAQLPQSHCVVRAGQQVWARYLSIYLDAPDRALYHAHRCGRRPRYKVRIRHHLDRGLSFLEIKKKDRTGHTAKFRLAVPFGDCHLGPRGRAFVDTHAPLEGWTLLPCVSVSFQRLTLVGSAINERVTLDRELTVAAGSVVAPLGGVVIAEVKQFKYFNHAGAVAALRRIHAREVALSKYCLATALVAPVPANVFKPALTALARLTV